MTKLLEKGINWCCDVISTRTHKQTKKLQKTKPLIFPNNLSTRLLKAECFTKIVKRFKILRVVGNFKKSTNEVASTLRVFIRGFCNGGSTHKTFSITS